jgi:hypothetical protein
MLDDAGSREVYAKRLSNGVFSDNTHFFYTLWLGARLERILR